MITRKGVPLKLFKPSAIHTRKPRYRLSYELGVYFPYGTQHWFMGAYFIPVKDIIMLRSMFKVIPD